MTSNFLHLATTPSVTAVQERYLGRAHPVGEAPPDDRLGDVEREFIQARDSFYMASVAETGWPYVQHRGGPAGFLRVLSENTIGFADVRGNRQLLSTGNVMANDRVALFLMDYPQRSRLKILGRARVMAASENSELAAKLTMPGLGLAERLFVIEVVAYDWNCPKYITPRYTREEVQQVVAPLQKKIVELEANLAAFRSRTGELKS
jgi:predicted pyridoxine 5'-phosphate oxidase superfamily flavin-nucleotide-binding protein